MILCCNTNLSYLVPLVHGLQSCCCQNKFDFFVFFTCKGSKIWRACKNHLNHHLDHHPHGWQHFWGFFLASETFCGFQKLHCDDDGVGVSQTMQSVVLRQKENDFADGIIGCSSATIFIENNHLGGSKNEIMEVQRRRFMYIWLEEQTCFKNLILSGFTKWDLFGNLFKHSGWKCPKNYHFQQNFIVEFWQFCISENGNIWKNKKCENSNETIFSDFQILWGYFYLEL